LEKEIEKKSSAIRTIEVKHININYIFAKEVVPFLEKVEYSARPNLGHYAN
jgi:hypothetical protein